MSRIGKTVQNRKDGGKRAHGLARELRTRQEKRNSVGRWGGASLYTELWTNPLPPKFRQPASTDSEELSSAKIYFRESLS